jgi:TolB-like protein/Flp pilus assembly protein TadD
MAASNPSADLVREELQKILASPGFARNERLGQFLRFVVDNQLQDTPETLKEFTVGVDVFGRKPDYDPKLDSIVRTEASRLRKRLAEYYEANGGSHRVIIEIPKGGYTPVFRPAAAPGIRRATSWKKTSLLTAGAALAGLLTFFYVTQEKTAPPVVAVLPLKNLSTEPDSDLFVDGLTDEIIRNLSIIEGLETRSQTSTFTFKDKPYNIREAGRQLGADYLIEGSVLRAGAKLRINARLIRVSDDTPVESWRVDRDLEDIFVIQDEISRSVVNQLRLRLGRGKRRYNTNAETYDVYLKARSLLLRRTERARTIDLFSHVIQRDPAFAPAYAGLTRTYVLFGLGNPVQAAERYKSMRSAAEKALQLDPLLAEAHAAMGLIYRLDRDWASAESTLQRAIDLDPSLTDVHLDRATGVLFPAGRFDEALREIDRAARVDPLSPAVSHDRALILMAAGRFDEAIQNCLPLVAQDPPFYLAEQVLARALVQQGKFAEAIPILERQVQVNGDAYSHYLGYAYALAGRRAEAEALAARNANYAFRLVIIYAGLGDQDRTLAALEKMADIKEPRAASYTVFPELAFLRDDVRFKAFRRKLGLPGDLPVLGGGPK